MPKKFATENSKAATARARKAAVKEQENVKKKQEMEDALWQEDDKLVLRKLQRKEEKIKKKEDQASKKAENKALLENEVTSTKSKTLVPTKVTRSEIQNETEKKRKETEEENKEKVETHLTKPLEENINRIQIEGEEARSVTEAIAVLSIKEQVEDKHPEKRLKAAYTAFEEKNMQRIKEENPTLRLSQLKQILRKEWMKSPENPTNAHV